jgi:hypothetical protein
MTTQAEHFFRPVSVGIIGRQQVEHNVGVKKLLNDAHAPPGDQM